MGKLFTITEEIRDIARDGIDDMIDQLGKDCKLVYPSVKTDCPNCVFDPTTNRSTGRYKTGGPRPFPNGTICPVCRGAGRLDSTETDIIRMLCKWNPKEFIPLAGSLQLPNSIVRTKGYITDLPKVLRSKKMILQLPIEPYIRYTFDLQGEPIDAGNIVQGRYFIAIWKRAGAG